MKMSRSVDCLLLIVCEYLVLLLVCNGRIELVQL